MKIQNVNATADSKLKEFFLDQLQDIYRVERKPVKILPKDEDAATIHQLKDGFSNHLEETRNRVIRLEDVFNMMGGEANATKCRQWQELWMKVLI